MYSLAFHIPPCFQKGPATFSSHSPVQLGFSLAQARKLQQCIKSEGSLPVPTPRPGSWELHQDYFFKPSTSYLGLKHTFQLEGSCPGAKELGIAPTLLLSLIVGALLPGLSMGAASSHWGSWGQATERCVCAAAASFCPLYFWLQSRHSWKLPIPSSVPHQIEIAPGEKQ